ERHRLLHLLGGVPRPLRNHLYVHILDVGERLHGEVGEGAHPEYDAEQGDAYDQEPLTEGEADEAAQHQWLWLASASRRRLPRVTTRSPSRSPLVIAATWPSSSPTLTGRRTNRPGAASTYTTVVLPRVTSASTGTTGTRAVSGARSRASPKTWVRSAWSELGSTARIVAVRVWGSSTLLT